MRFSFYSTLALGALFAADKVRAFNLEEQDNDETLLAEVENEDTWAATQDLYSLLAQVEANN